IHGDAYLSNFLMPRSGHGPAILLDWQSPEFDLGALDLANMCATFWTREQRHAREERALRRYHAALDVPGYPFDDLMGDYRLAVADWLLIPVQDAFDGSPPMYWGPKMRCLAQAAIDHAIVELF